MSAAKLGVVGLALVAGATASLARGYCSQIGNEKAVPVHLVDGQEFEIPLQALIAYGHKLFVARFTGQDGAGRPLTKGNGKPLTDPTSPLVLLRNFNRLSGPESNSCAGCHDMPRPGGGGDMSSNVFVLAQRFDFLTFDHNNTMPLRVLPSGTKSRIVDENGRPETWPPGLSPGSDSHAGGRTGFSPGRGSR